MQNGLILKYMQRNKCSTEVSKIKETKHNKYITMAAQIFSRSAEYFSSEILFLPWL
jgi:hypothetical protein